MLHEDIMSYVNFDIITLQTYTMLHLILTKYKIK